MIFKKKKKKKKVFPIFGGFWGGSLTGGSLTGGTRYHLLTPSTLTIDRATSCRLLEYIRSVATASVP